MGTAELTRVGDVLAGNVGSDVSTTGLKEAASRQGRKRISFLP